jgi:hypothetical protein
MTKQSNIIKIFTGALVLVAYWILFFQGSLVSGQSEAGQSTVDLNAQVYEISTSFTPDFGQDWARATTEIIRRQVIDWQNDLQVASQPTIPGAKLFYGNRLHFDVLRILIGLAIFIMLICALIFARWIADFMRIAKYRPDTGKICFRWWVGRFTIAVIGLLIIVPFLPGMVHRSPGPQAEAVEPRQPQIVSITIVVNDPCETPIGSVERCLLSYSDQLPDAQRLALQIKQVLVTHGLVDLEIEPSPAHGTHAISLQLHGHARFELDLRHPAKAPVDPIITNLCEKLPLLAITSTSSDGEIPDCVIRYAESNPLAALAAREMHSVLEGNGFAPTVVGESSGREMRVIFISIPQLSDMKLVLHHLPTQDLANLKSLLEQEKVTVILRPSETPPVASGVLYYPTGDGGLEALAAREKADRFLQLAYQQGFLGHKTIPSWGVPMARATEVTFELSVVPIRKTRDVEIFCDQAFNSKLRPIVLQKLGSDQYKLKVRFEATLRNPAAEPGVIRYADANDRHHAERLRAVLSETVGLVNLHVAETEEPQLERMSVWLSYNQNGAFHQFVDTLINSLPTTTRDSIRELYSDQGWAEDRVARYEYGPSCLKLLPLTGTDFTDDWIQRFIRPGTWRLATLRLQQEGVGGWCSVIPTTRVIITDVTSSGFKIDSVPEEHIVDTAVPERFNVVLVGGSKDIRNLLGRYDARVEGGNMPPGATGRSIYFPEHSEGGQAIARIAKAILEENKLYYSLKSYTNQGDTKVYIVASAGQETSNE